MWKSYCSFSTPFKVLLNYMKKERDQVNCRSGSEGEDSGLVNMWWNWKIPVTMPDDSSRRPIISTKRWNKIEVAGFGSRVSMVASSEGSWMEISKLELDVFIARERDLLTNLGFDGDGLELMPNYTAVPVFLAPLHVHPS